MRQTHPGKAKRGARLNARYAPLLAPAIMAMAMSLVMSLVQAIVRLGLTANLVPAWLTSFAIGMIVAVPTAVLVAPHAQRLASHLTGASHQSAQHGRRLDH